MMGNIELTAGVLVMFLLRIGLPVLLLIALGVFIERWQSVREREIQQRYPSDEQRYGAT